MNTSPISVLTPDAHAQTAARALRILEWLFRASAAVALGFLAVYLVVLVCVGHQAATTVRGVAQAAGIDDALPLVSRMAIVAVLVSLLMPHFVRCLLGLFGARWGGRGNVALSALLLVAISLSPMLAGGLVRGGQRLWQLSQGQDSDGLPVAMTTVDPAAVRWFTPQGQPLLWWEASPEGRRVFWSRPGHSPLTNVRLEPVTTELRAAWEKEQAAAVRRAESIERRKRENAARAEQERVQAENARRARETEAATARKASEDAAARAARAAQEAEAERAREQQEIQARQAEARKMEAERLAAEASRREHLAFEEARRAARLAAPASELSAAQTLLHAQEADRRWREGRSAAAAGGQGDAPTAPSQLTVELRTDVAPAAAHSFALRRGQTLNIHPRGRSVEVWSDGSIEIWPDHPGLQRRRLAPGERLAFDQYRAQSLHAAPLSSGARHLFLRELE